MLNFGEIGNIYIYTSWFLYEPCVDMVIIH